MPYLSSISPNRVNQPIQAMYVNVTVFLPHWIAPPFHHVKINYDASFYSADKYIGIGLLLRDNTGSWLGARSITGYALSAEESEALAILYTLQWALSLNLDRVVFEGDCHVIT
ncbi:hypothetical protein BVC80_8571g6 [Macleaya cordata]|uniref:RNase H type-1 domain-containing protein n=1 Tax=Macleaya cordata TaxID=56857 RepID=A0A200QLV0_MACCD|nr:hypothetical protein BVC80_8571g6 [Macleaya cordata]